MDASIPGIGKTTNWIVARRVMVLPSGFEPESKPREGFMIGHYTTGA